MCQACYGLPDNCVICGYVNDNRKDTCNSCLIATAKEQARIIKLLDNAYRRYTRKSINGDLIAIGAANATVELIALINGEK